jgi:hypothetical protein
MHILILILHSYLIYLVNPNIFNFINIINLNLNLHRFIILLLISIVLFNINFFINHFEFILKITYIFLILLMFYDIYLGLKKLYKYE